MEDRLRKINEEFERRLANKDPRVARANLIAAGILDSDGNVAEPYKEVLVPKKPQFCIVSYRGKKNTVVTDNEYEANLLVAALMEADVTGEVRVTSYEEPETAVYSLEEFYRKGRR